ncbi:dTMP kinase [Actinomycetaceae bacterium WB03_NA08]|uniref:Thymidylate kinase n=1 Tax=Scrofimicrobium canadense TaxID=2652290 RepID=A0A6N7W1D0_9ACTO|nr:dTMP kinase [Scrofimicrobium canadense]MSS83201.1 dTMP kinase [Scrofimicrobium canadense]
MTAVDALSAALKDRPRGFFIAFEGGDGSGKSTQLELLRRRLDAPLVFTREPGGTPLGNQIRNLVMHGPDNIDARTEALLYAADRAYHVATTIRPALSSGKTVITDRYIDSSVAYQGLGRGLGVEAIRDLSLWAVDGLEPDLVVVFDVPVEVGLQRAGAEPDRIERAGKGFHEEVRAQYLSAAAAKPQQYRVIDSTLPVEEVFALTIDALLESCS